MRNFKIYTSESPLIRTLFSLATLLMSWLLCVDTAVLAQNPQRPWKKADPNALSYFVPMGQQQWIEVHENGSQVAFAETSSSPTTVELFDQGRDLRIRLHDQYAELAVGKQAYQRWVNGNWIAREELPENAQLAPIDHRVRLIYFVPRDRQPTAQYAAKIRCVMSFVNSLYRYEFRRRGWDDRGLLFQEDGTNLPIVHLIHGKHDAAYYTGSPNYDGNRQYSRMQVEIPASIGHPTNQLIVAFLETYDEGPHAFEWPGGVALGGRYSVNGGLGIFSSWILRDEFCATTVSEQVKLFQDTTPIKGRVALGHGRLDSPRFEFIEDGFGAVAHEVGHALGLPHDQRDDEHYIMGNGFRKLRVNLSDKTPVEQRARFSDANANMLRASRHLNPATPTDDVRGPTVQATWQAAANSRGIVIDLVAGDDRGLSAWLVLDGHSGNVLAGEPLTGTQVTQRIELDLPAAAADREYPIRLLVSDLGGNHAQVDIKNE